MHYNFCYCCIVHTNLSINGKKKRSHVQNCPCGMVDVKIGYVLELLVQGKVIVEFGRKVFLVDCLSWETLNMAKISITESALESVFMHTKSPSVIIQGYITLMRYRNDVIRSVLLLHMPAYLCMMLARDYTSCHATRSRLVMLVANNVQKLRWPANSLNLNLIDHLLDLLKHSRCN